MLEANLADRQVVQYVIRRFGIHAKHKLGQNFLIRPDVVAAIAEAAELGEHVPVMEIGAGIGTLTQALAETGADVTAFELDRSLERVLSHTLEHYKNIHIIYEDVLKADLKTILALRRQSALLYHHPHSPFSHSVGPAHFSFCIHDAERSGRPYPGQTGLQRLWCPDHRRQFRLHGGKGA